MEFGLKDIVYLIIYVVTLSAVYFRQNNRIKNIEALKKVVFKSNGVLSLVEVDTCKAHQDNIHIAIRREADNIGNMKTKIDKMGDNILRIMVHMKIESDKEK